MIKTHRTKKREKEREREDEIRSLPKKEFRIMIVSEVKSLSHI